MPARYLIWCVFGAECYSVLCDVSLHVLFLKNTIRDVFTSYVLILLYSTTEHTQAIISADQGSAFVDQYSSFCMSAEPLNACFLSDVDNG